MGSLVSGVAHELNNPLQAVFGFTDLLLRRPLDPAVRADVDQIRFKQIAPDASSATR